MSEQKRKRYRVSFGISISSIVPRWGSGKRLWFYAFANRPNEHSYGCVGFKAGVVFVRFVYGRPR